MAERRQQRFRSSTYPVRVKADMSRPSIKMRAEEPMPTSGLLNSVNTSAKGAKRGDEAGLGWAAACSFGCHCTRSMRPSRCIALVPATHTWQIGGRARPPAGQS